MLEKEKRNPSKHNTKVLRTKPYQLTCGVTLVYAVDWYTGLALGAWGRDAWWAGGKSFPLETEDCDCCCWLIACLHIS